MFGNTVVVKQIGCGRVKVLAAVSAWPPLLYPSSSGLNIWLGVREGRKPPDYGGII